MKNFELCTTPEMATKKLSTLYAGSIGRLRAALAQVGQGGALPTAAERAQGAFVYPELRVIYKAGDGPTPRFERAFARFHAEGTYVVTITQPDLFHDYLCAQLTPLMTDYDVEVFVGPSQQEIPYSFVLDGVAEGAVAGLSADELARHFPAPHLAHIGDKICDGHWHPSPSEHIPLALFEAPRVDFSLARLRHYTGTAPEHFQRFILFTNYHRYVDEFVRYSLDELGKGGRYKALACSGGVYITPETKDAEAVVADSASRKHQMPAYHLVAEDGLGISLVNIGVGPSNAKTITDHLAVLRPEAWLMIGHCGGLRASQRIGDYVLAHAYLRDDNVLNDVLPPEIPLPAIAEVQQALAEASAQVTGEAGGALKTRLRTGTVVTTDDRNWELRYNRSALRFNQSRAVAIDMESGTIAAQGYRFRVPYGTLLCVSDKPLHGEIKLPGQANSFYERAISEHIRIGIAAVDLLRQTGERLHSRKLRAFDEPPFR